MRIIPKRTKVSTEFFRGVSITDILVGFFGLLILFFVFISSLPGRLWIDLGVFFVFALLLARIDEEPNYMFMLQLLRHFSHERRYQKLSTRELNTAKTKKAKKGNRGKGKKALTPESYEEEFEPEEIPPAPVLSKKEKKSAEKADKILQKQKKKAKRAEDKFLKNKKIPEEEKAAIRSRRQQEAEERYYKAKVAEQKQKRKNIEQMTLITEIHGGYIYYGGEYYGAAIEIPAVEFRFFSSYRRTAAIDTALGSVIRSVGARYAANLVKIERPLVLDEYIAGEYDKIDALKRSYERGVFSEEELKARIEVVYDRINQLRERNLEDKVLVPHFYLVLFDSDKRQLENQVQTALSALRMGEMSPHRLDDKELAVFLRYTNSVDFDEREIEELDEAEYARFILPQSLELKMRTAEVNSIITHNFRVINYPLEVSDAWGAALFDIPGTKVVMKFSQMDRDKSIRAIDRSISELSSQLDKTSISSRIIELQTHIETLSELLVMLQNNNENLMAMNLYITAYDIAATRENKLLVPQPPPSALPRISGMKKDVKRTFSEQSFKLTDLTAQQFEAFVATQVNGYDPFAKKARGVPASTVAGVFPWVYANLSDKKGLNLGSSDGVPTFVDFFRRDSERVNSNMVIVGKSGGGKSYATKSILTNLAADDAKIFVLDPENEYTELAANLKGKFINTANATNGRINPFHIITSLEDDEAASGQETSSYAAHLQFLEEFFRQILPDIDVDALEYLNNLINRIYNQKGIDQYTNLNALKPEDYPIFDDLYDCILEEFQRTKSDYLKSNLRVLMNYIAKFSTGGRNANIWNGPSTLSTAENFIVFNFQTLLANRNNTVANAQMLLVLKYLDNEIIKNREYNIKYGANRKIIVVIDEAHVFIDAKYPLALDFMFQLAKRIRKYNGMQIVITQNIKDFVGSEELARKSTAIINACQYSFIFSLAPNDMHDLCTLYEKAGGINESEQEQIISAPRGQAFVVTGPTSRSCIRIETPKPIEEMFSSPLYATHYFGGDEGKDAWEDVVSESRPFREEWENAQAISSLVTSATDHLPNFRDMGVELVELEQGEEEVLLMDDGPAVADSLPKHMKAQAAAELLVEEESEDNVFSPESLQRYGFEALVNEIRRTVRQEVESELGGQSRQAPVFPESVPSQPTAQPETFTPPPQAPASPPPAPSVEETWAAPVSPTAPAQSDWFAPAAPAQDDWFAPAAKAQESSLDDMFDKLFADQPPLEQKPEERPEPQSAAEPEPWTGPTAVSASKEKPAPEEEVPASQFFPADQPEEAVEEEPLLLVFEVTLEQLMAME